MGGPCQPRSPEGIHRVERPLEAGVAAGGGRERRSRPGREGGGGRPAGELGRNRLGCSWAAEQQGSRGQTANNGDPASEAAPGKRLGPKDRQWGEAGMEGCGSPSCAPCVDSPACLSVSQLILSSHPASPEDLAVLPSQPSPARVSKKEWMVMGQP